MTTPTGNLSGAAGSVLTVTIPEETPIDLATFKEIVFGIWHVDGSNSLEKTIQLPLVSTNKATRYEA